MRSLSDYPLVQFEQLRIDHGVKLGDTATIPLRDYREWNRLPSIIRREKFFNTKMEFIGGSQSNNINFENILQYDPVLVNCLARWLLVNYKLNYYPYYDLNICSIYTDLPQSIQVAKKMMQYFKQELSPDMYDKIKFYMIPLYEHDPVYAMQSLKNISHSIHCVENFAVFSSPIEGMNDPMHKFSVDDPVYILMLNDIIKNMAHDLARYSKEKGHWEQCYLDINEQGVKTRRYDTNIDYWCQTAIDYAYSDVDPNSIADTEIYIPTRLVQLFEMIKRRVPEHKLFAIDSPRRWKPSLSRLIRVLCGHKSVSGSSLQLDNSYITDFTQLKEIYEQVNESMQYCAVEDLSQFIDKWSDEEDDKQTLKILNQSSLAIFHN